MRSIFSEKSLLDIHSHSAMKQSQYHIVRWAWPWTPSPLPLSPIALTTFSKKDSIFCATMAAAGAGAAAPVSHAQSLSLSLCCLLCLSSIFFLMLVAAVLCMGGVCCRVIWGRGGGDLAVDGAWKAGLACFWWREVVGFLAFLEMEKTAFVGCLLCAGFFSVLWIGDVWCSIFCGHWFSFSGILFLLLLYVQKMVLLVERVVEARLIGSLVMCRAVCLVDGMMSDVMKLLDSFCCSLTLVMDFHFFKYVSPSTEVEFTPLSVVFRLL